MSLFVILADTVNCIAFFIDFIIERVETQGIISFFNSTSKYVTT